MSGIAYVDASAFVKLIVPEPESAALAEAIASAWPHVVSNEILAIECNRVALRVGGDAPALAIERLKGVALISLTPKLRDQAQQIGPSELRTLDAIHLATAISVSEQIGTVFTYDARLADAARAEGLAVLAPA